MPPEEDPLVRAIRESGPELERDRRRVEAFLDENAQAKEMELASRKVRSAPRCPHCFSQRVMLTRRATGATLFFRVLAVICFLVAAAGVAMILLVRHTPDMPPGASKPSADLWIPVIILTAGGSVMGYLARSRALFKCLDCGYVLPYEPE